MPTISKLDAYSPRITPKIRTAAYARVSLETEKLLHSLSAQVSYYSNYIQSNPAWIFAGVYVDDGITGTSTVKREEFKRMLADCDAGRIDLVLTKSVSRFARDTVDCLNTVRHLKDIGVEVRFEREGISTFDAGGELLLTLLAAFAQAESDSISSNVKWTARKKFEEGIPNGHKAVFGYAWDGDIYRIVPEQGAVVQEIFKRYLAGEPAYSIGKDLKARGITGLSGKAMVDSTIRGIISNVSYTGTMLLQKNYISSHVRKQNRGELPMYAVEEMYEPLISVDDFEKAQVIKQQRADEIPEYIPTRYSGIIKCGNCGCGVSRRSPGTKKKWVCNTRERKGKAVCDTNPITEDELDDAVMTALGEISDSDFLRTVKRITIYNDRIEFRCAFGKLISVERHYGGFKVRNAFSGKLFCGECGEKLGRDTWKKRENGQERKVHSWSCIAPGCSCGLKRISEAELYKATEVMLNTDSAEPAFAALVEKAMVTNTEVKFYMKDGDEKVWQIK